MDIYIIICFFAVFAALVEFACINFIDTFIKRFKAWEEEEKKRLEKVEEEKKLLLETSLDEGNREDGRKRGNANGRSISEFNKQNGGAEGDGMDN